MYTINKIALFIANPITIGVVFFIGGFLLKLIGLRVGKFNLIKARRLFKIAWLLVAFSGVWFLLWSIPIVGQMTAKLAGLDEYNISIVETLPKTEAIVDLGGGMGGGEDKPYADMQPGGDRAWHAARLWKAGRAPIVVTSGKYTRITDAPLICDLGVPVDAIVVEDESRNTEENAIYTERILREKLKKTADAKISVLLVTSVFHLKRAMMIFKKAAPGLVCIPAGTDYGSYDPGFPMRWEMFTPSVGALGANMVLYKELLGVIGYKLRGF